MKYCDKVNIGDLFDEKKPALYAWTGDEDFMNTSKNTKYKIKIGMSLSVCQRLYNYHTSHPDGVWILDLMRVKTTATKKDLLGLEKQLQNELKQYFYQAPSRAINRGEWYICTEAVMNNAFKKVCINNKSLCIDVIQPPPTIRGATTKPAKNLIRNGQLVRAGTPAIKSNQKTKKLNSII